MARPYFHSSLRELKELFSGHQDDVTILSALLAELRLRDRAPAVSLRGEIQQRLDELNGRRTTRDGAQAGPKRRPNESTCDPLPSPETRGGAASSAETNTERSHIGPVQETYLRRPARFKRMEPLGVSGRPSKYARPLKTDVILPVTNNMPRPDRYVLALGALIAEMRRNRQSTRQIILENGRRIELDGGHIGYAFAFTEDAELFEEARVELRIGARSIEGNIISIASGQVVIAVEEDLGEKLLGCVLVIDNTALLEALKEKLEQSKGGGRQLNVALADDAVINSGRPVPFDTPLSSDAFLRLNYDQKNAVRLALSNATSYLWGPPGTGKTTTLSVVILMSVVKKTGRACSFCGGGNSKMGCA